MHILESEANKPFKVKGIAMKRNSISKNGYRYSGQLVDKTVALIQESIKSNGSYPITMMADHPTAVANKTLSIIGKITDMYLEGDNAVVEAEIANTTVGKDVQELIKGKFVEGLSIRASNAQYKRMNIGDRLVKDVLEMELKGVDLVANPGVDGARITDIIESDQTDAPNQFYITLEESYEIKPQKEENTLDLNKLKQDYPDLVESIQNEYKQIMESQKETSELQESFDKVKGEKELLESKVSDIEKALTESEDKIKTLQESETELKTKLEEAEGKLKEIEEEAASAERKAHIEEKLAGLKFADSVKGELRKKVEVLESIEEIDSVLESETNYLNLVIKESTGIDLGKGKTGDNGSYKSSELQEEEDFINKVMGS